MAKRQRRKENSRRVFGPGALARGCLLNATILYFIPNPQQLPCPNKIFIARPAEGRVYYFSAIFFIVTIWAGVCPSFPFQIPPFVLSAHLLCLTMLVLLLKNWLTMPSMRLLLLLLLKY